jgi:hypothetical protein
MTRGTFLPDFNLTFVITLVFLLSVGAARPLLGAQNDDSDSPPEVAEVQRQQGNFKRLLLWNLVWFASVISWLSAISICANLNPRGMNSHGWGENPAVTPARPTIWEGSICWKEESSLLFANSKASSPHRGRPRRRLRMTRGQSGSLFPHCINVSLPHRTGLTGTRGESYEKEAC